MRWFHESLDRLHVSLVNRLMPGAFRHGSTSPGLHQHLAAVRLELPPLTAARQYRVMAETLIGPVETGYHVRLGARADLPVLVYHHGIAEMPYDKSFRLIFRTRQPIPAHLAAVQAPFHRSWFTVREGVSTLNHFMAMCAVSVKLMDAVRGLLAEHGARGSLLTGTSLGGYITLLHHLLLGTAERYVPLLAGPDLAHVMLATHYRRLLAPQALAQAEHIQSRLDYRQAFEASNTRRVFPLLARYDLDILCDYHEACYAASGVPVVTLPRGHITGAMAFGALRRHLLTCLAPLVHPAKTGSQSEVNGWLPQ
jgi:hypothetical protein